MPFLSDALGRFSEGAYTFQHPEIAIARRQQEEGEERANQQALGYLGASGVNIPGMNAPLPAYTGPSREQQQAQPFAQAAGAVGAAAGGMALPMPAQNDNPWTKKQVQDLEHAADMIRDEPSLDPQRKMALMAQVGQKLQNLDPQQQYRRHSTQMTAVDKFAANNVKMFPEHGLALAVDATGKPHWKDIPQREDDASFGTDEEKLAHFQKHTVRDPDTGNLYGYNRKTKEWKLIHEPQPKEDKEAETDAKEETSLLDKMEQDYERQQEREAGHVQKLLGGLASKSEPDEKGQSRFLSPEVIRQQARAAGVSDDLWARHVDFNEEAIAAHRDKFDQRRQQRLLEHRNLRSLRRKGDMTMPITIPERPKPPDPRLGAFQQRAAEHKQAAETGYTSPATAAAALKRNPLSPIAPPSPQQDPVNVMLQSAF